MPVVEGGKLALVEPLDQGEHAGVNDPEWLVGVSGLKFVAALQVSGRRALGSVNAGAQVVEEDEPGRDAQSLVAPVIELGEYERRNDQVLVCLAQERGTSGVVWVGRIKSGK